MQSFECAFAILSQQVIAQLKIRELARPSNQLIDQFQGNATGICGGGGQLVQFGQQRLRIRSNKPDDFSQNLIVNSYLQFFQSRSGPGLCLCIFKGSKLNNGASLKESLRRFLALIELIRDK